jgi:hypothetical protein
MRPSPSRTSASSASAAPATCRGVETRVTIGQFRHLARQTFKNHSGRYASECEQLRLRRGGGLYRVSRLLASPRVG